MAKIIRYCVLEESHEGGNVFKVHRPFPLGNPFTHIKNKETKALVKVKDRDEAIRLYEPYFDKMTVEDEAFRKEWERLVEACGKHDTVYLGCYCKLDETCHADTIIKKLNQRMMKEHVKELLKRKKTGK